MSDETTPAIRRTARLLYPTLGGPNANWEIDNAREALEVGLDLEELAQAVLSVRDVTVWVPGGTGDGRLTRRSADLIAKAIRAAVTGGNR